MQLKNIFRDEAIAVAIWLIKNEFGLTEPQFHFIQIFGWTEIFLYPKDQFTVFRAELFAMIQNI